MRALLVTPDRVADVRYPARGSFGLLLELSTARSEGPGVSP